MKYVQLVLVYGYVCAIAAAPCVHCGARAFWTVLMPMLPLGVVLLGFHFWRRACPIASIGGVAAQARVPFPRALKRWPLTLALGLLYLCLSLRHVATNGDGAALALFLAALPLAALVVNAVFGGKTWCNYLCPIGVVERIYTDGAPLRAHAGSACARCSGCKKSCPDIDQMRATESALTSSDRRIAFYSFPGLVFGFYFYFWLRAGDWNAYFDGRWTHAPAAPFAPGLFFWPVLELWLAAPLALAVVSLASFVLFALCEAVAARRWGASALLRRRVLALSAFVAFNVFYCFAGAPTLCLVPGLGRALAFVIPVIATVILVRRWPPNASPASVAPAVRALRVV